MSTDKSPDPMFEVASHDEPSGGTVVSVAGEVDVATSPELRRELHQVLDAGASRVVVDLSNTTFIDSSGLGVLVGALKRLREADQDTLVLTGLRDSVRRVFEITGLTDVFTIQD